MFVAGRRDRRMHTFDMKCWSTKVWELSWQGVGDGCEEAGGVLL